MAPNEFRGGEQISVCLLAYNHVAVIESTLDSILDQTIDGFEVIVSDDQSTDGTWERIQERAKSDSRIKPVRTPRNLGMAGNANFAVSKSARPYIALLHHDDLYRRDLLEKWFGVIERHPDVAFVFNAYGNYQSDRIDSGEIPSERVDGKWLLEKFLLKQWGCVVRGTAMIRRNSWNSIGGMREHFGLLADVDLWMRFARGWAVGYVDEPVIIVRHERPEDYPEIYKYGGWSWRRQRILCEIHATNQLEYLDRNSICGGFKWQLFRWRLSMETAKWLIYAVIRRKPSMITGSAESATSYDLWWLRTLRCSLRIIYR